MCDPPSLFSSSPIDGGLLILSRFPIVKSEFRPFNYGIGSDALTLKGVLYALININGRYLHLFQTHTQASYFNETVFEFESTIDTRKDQLKTFRRFIEEKTWNAPASHLIIACGDFNVNGNKIDKKECKVRELLKDKPEFNIALDDMDREYETFIDIMNKNCEDQCIDIMREANNGKSVVTFADAYFDENGQECPCDTVMTSKDDLYTKQCLDYIFEIKRSFNLA